MTEKILRLNSWAGLVLLSMGDTGPGRGCRVRIGPATGPLRIGRNRERLHRRPRRGRVVLDPDVRGGGTVTVTDELGESIATVTVPAGADKVHVQLAPRASTASVLTSPRRTGHGLQP